MRPIVPVLILGVLVVAGGALVARKSQEPGPHAVDPAKYLWHIPAGVPKEDTKLYEIHRLRGLIAYGDSVLVQVSAIGSRPQKLWKIHEEEARESVNALPEGYEVFHKGSLLRIPRARDKDDFLYYYLKAPSNLKHLSQAKLIAVCVGAFKLYEPDASCEFGYRTQNNFVNFNIDEKTVNDTSVRKIETKVFGQLGIDPHQVIRYPIDGQQNSGTSMGSR